jgi:uncharacterized protein (DUF1499 family)
MGRMSSIMNFRRNSSVWFRGNTLNTSSVPGAREFGHEHGGTSDMNHMAIALLFLGSLLSACSNNPSSSLGVREGLLAPCPDRPNCVSSQSADKAHTIAPLVHGSISGSVMANLSRVVGSLKGASIVEESPAYLRVEFRSALFGFTDDVECVPDPGARLIHIRSASRIGYWDFGVNRRRVEKIRSLWSQP